MSEPDLIGGVEPREIHLAAYDPSWSQRYLAHAERIRSALGEAVLSVEHVGSTSVPELAAKPIVDIVIEVHDSSNELSYLPALTGAGYRLRVREPAWHEHRMLRTSEIDVHVHVFSRGCSEVKRMLAFRDRLRRSTEDRRRYEAVKRELAAMEWPDMNAYADAKSAIVESILARCS